MILAVDIGGTKTLVALFDNGAVSQKLKFPTPKAYSDFKTNLADVLSKLDLGKLEKTVVAVPAILDRNKGLAISFGNLAWQDVPIKADVQTIVKSTVLIENDAKLGALAEAKALGSSYKKVLYLTISTGIGIGLIVDGKIDLSINDRGGNGIMIDKDGEQVSWESFASGKAIVNRYGKLASEISDPVTWQQIADDLAVGIEHLLEVLTPDAIVIGGGVGASFDKFGGLLTARLKKSELAQIPILPAKHPEEAVIYGCYEYAKQN